MSQGRPARLPAHHSVELDRAPHGSRLGLTAYKAENASTVVPARSQAALSPVSPRPARPRDAGDPPHQRRPSISKLPRKVIRSNGSNGSNWK